MIDCCLSVFDLCVYFCFVSADDPAFRRGNHLEQRERLGLSSTSKGQSNIRTPPPESTNALQKVEVCVYDYGFSEEMEKNKIEIGNENVPCVLVVLWNCTTLFCVFLTSSCMLMPNRVKFTIS